MPDVAALCRYCATLLLVTEFTPAEMMVPHWSRLLDKVWAIPEIWSRILWVSILPGEVTGVVNELEKLDIDAPRDKTAPYKYLERLYNFLIGAARACFC